MPLTFEQLTKVTDFITGAVPSFKGWPYLMTLVEPLTQAEIDDLKKSTNWKIISVYAEEIARFVLTMQDIQDAHFLDKANDKSLELWAKGFYNVDRFAGWDNDTFRDWIKFHILKTRVKGSVEVLRIVVAAYLDLVAGNAPPWPDIGMFLDDTDQVYLDLATQNLASWAMLGNISAQWNAWPHIAFDSGASDAGYLGIEIHYTLLDQDFGNAFGAAPDADATSSDPNELGYWFVENTGGGFDDSIFDGHHVVTDLLEIMREAAPATSLTDIVVKGFGVADNALATSGDPNDLGYWFIADAVNGFDAGRMPGSVKDSKGVLDARRLKVYERAPWAYSKNPRHYVLNPVIVSGIAANL